MHSLQECMILSGGTLVDVKMFINELVGKLLQDKAISDWK